MTWVEKRIISLLLVLDSQEIGIHFIFESLHCEGEDQRFVKDIWPKRVGELRF